MKLLSYLFSKSTRSSDSRFSAFFLDEDVAKRKSVLEKAAIESNKEQREVIKKYEKKHSPKAS